MGEPGGPAVRQEGASTLHVTGTGSPDGKDKAQEFKFDAVLGADATQEEVFDSVPPFTVHKHTENMPVWLWQQPQAQ